MAIFLCRKKTTRLELEVATLNKGFAQVPRGARLSLHRVGELGIDVHKFQFTVTSHHHDHDPSY